MLHVVRFLGFIRYTDIADQNGFHYNDLISNTGRLSIHNNNMVFGNLTRQEVRQKQVLSHFNEVIHYSYFTGMNYHLRPFVNQ